MLVSGLNCQFAWNGEAVFDDEYRGNCLVNAMAARSKVATQRLAEAVGKHEEGHQAEIDRLAGKIRQAGIGNDETAEQEYCRLLLERHRVGQTG